MGGIKAPPPQAYGLVKIRLQVVDHNGYGRMVGRHILCVLEDAAANPSRFLLDDAVVCLLMIVDLPVEHSGVEVRRAPLRRRLQPRSAPPAERSPWAASVRPIPAVVNTAL